MLLHIESKSFLIYNFYIGDHKGPVPIVKKVLKKRSSKDSVSSDDDDDNDDDKDGKLFPSLSPSRFKLQPKKIGTFISRILLDS